MQEQTELGKTEPEQEDGESDRNAVDPSGKVFDEVGDLRAPVRHLLFVLFDGCKKILQAGTRLRQVTAQ